MKNKLITLTLILVTLRGFTQVSPVPTPQWRPVYHFTPDKYWTNDPNGLLYLNGKYQLYYQHNPFENKWGHISWGHAESTDLINWQHLPLAIPEVVSKDTTTWIYSGSAVLDKDNTSGFGANGKAPLVAIFTADQPKQQKESQFIAYSNDEGRSFHLYDKNPVIDLHLHDFRDPNVFWFSSTKQWIMTVSKVGEHKIRFYGSADLKHWDQLSDFGPAGNIKNAWECPSLVPLPVDGNPAKIKYILFVSCFGEHGPQVQYFIGDFDGKQFTNINQSGQFLNVDNGDCFYAAIAWRNAPVNKQVFLGWLINGKQETWPWKGQMSIPRDLSIRTTPAGLRLFQKPASAVVNALHKYQTGSPLVTKTLAVDNSVLLSTATRFRSNALWIDATLTPGKSSRTGFWLAANSDGSRKVVVGYDAERKEIYVDCSSTEAGHKDASNLRLTAPLQTLNDGNVRLEILLDKSSLEVFGNNGEQVITTMIYPGDNENQLSAFATGHAVINNLHITEVAQH